jgi:hypothetical protein
VAAPVHAPATAGGGGGQGAQQFLDQLKRLEPLALAMVAGAVFLLSTFLPWATIKASAGGQSQSDSFNAWSGEAPWLIRGFSVDDAVDSALRQSDISAGTDMLLLLPLALIAVGLMVAVSRGATIPYAREVAVGCAGLLTVLVLVEGFHLTSFIGDFEDGLRDVGGQVQMSGGPAFGLWLGALAAAGLTFAAVKSWRTAKNG